MNQRSTAALVFGAAFALFAGGIASAATRAIVAQATPAPKPAPNPITFSGYDRAFYFTRSNLAAGKVNQATFNNAVNLHAQYKFLPGLSAGATYLYANPFNDCTTVQSHYTPGPCAFKTAPAPIGYPQPTTWDDTLPGYMLSTLYEAYVQYKDPVWYFKIGDQVINTPWANASDSRLKPSAFQGADLAYTLSKAWTIEGAYYDKWEDRVQNNFVNSTLITQKSNVSLGNVSPYPDDGGIGNIGLATDSVYTNNGFSYGRLGYASGAFAGNLYFYGFDQIAGAVWIDGKYSWKTFAKPFITFQGGAEQNAGTSLAGKISSRVVGIQFGITPLQNVDLTLGVDDIPQKSDTITLPVTTKCGTNNVISGTLQYFLPGGGTPNCYSATLGVTGAVATVYYGGWASPYTDSYATDQLFTTTISQGMVDRHSPGSSLKLASTVSLDGQQIRIIVAHAWYQYGNGTTGYAPTQETNVDGTYFFSKVPKSGPYRGFSIRHRYAERMTGPGTIFGALPDFKYNRTQLEYDF
jgi:hypothetical protein